MKAANFKKKRKELKKKKSKEENGLNSKTKKKGTEYDPVMEAILRDKNRPKSLREREAEKKKKKK